MRMRLLPCRQNAQPLTQNEQGHGSAWLLLEADRTMGGTALSAGAP